MDVVYRPEINKFAVCEIKASNPDGTLIYEMDSGIELFNSLQEAKEYASGMSIDNGLFDNVRHSVSELKQPLAEYSPEQARDSQGRWTSGDLGFSPLSKEESHNEAKVMHNDMAKSQGNKTTSNTKGAINRYESRKGYINSQIRSKQQLSPEDDKSVAIMDHVTRNSVIPHDLAAYMGTGNNVTSNLEKMKVGEDFSEKGFITGNTSSRDAMSNVGRDKGGFIKLEIPKGSNGFVNGESSKTSVTLPRDSTFMLMQKTSVAIPSSSGQPARMVPVYHIRLLSKNPE